MLIVIRINDNNKIVSLWLAGEDSHTGVLPEEIRNTCDAYRARKYMIAVFRSGKDDLYGNTIAMLKHNRQLTAENEVKQVKIPKTKESQV